MSDDEPRRNALPRRGERCCMSDDPEHHATRRCGRRAASRIDFANGPCDCFCGTCDEHAAVVNGVTLCGGCAMEGPSPAGYDMLKPADHVR